jgi:hypothetical protein
MQVSPCMFRAMLFETELAPAPAKSSYMKLRNNKNI